MIEQAKFAYYPLERAFERKNRKAGWGYKVSRPL